MDIDKILQAENIIISLGRELNKKEVLSSDDNKNMKNLEKILNNLLVIQKRLNK